ncbi:MAG: L-ribulose-5-phosphate 4-epimerase [Anaerovoracaceae bacterium]
MLEDLRKKVCDANIEMYEEGVVIYTWGNVSGIDRDKGIMAIKPSGVDYDVMKPEDMVLVDLETGKTVDSELRPSSDTDTHLELYMAFPEIGGIAHTHSINAVAFAQAGSDIPALGTTHADYFYGDVPCTRELTEEETKGAYELNTGRVIVEHIREAGYDPMAVPGILVRSHGPFAWGTDAADAVYNAVVIEKIAEMALKTLRINPDASMPQYILDKHYFKKHGAGATYGQAKKK